MTERLFENIKASSSIVHPDDIRKFYRLDVAARFAQAKAEHPDYRKHQLCALIGVSDSYLKRVMKDLDIKSFYRHDIPVNTPRKKKSKSKDSRQSHAKEENVARIEDPQSKTVKQKIKKKQSDETSEIKAGKTDEEIDEMITNSLNNLTTPFK